MGLDAYLQKALLDFATGAAAVTRPSNRWVQLATASPTSVSAFDGPFQSRVSFSAAAANSPQGSMTNRAAVTGGTATAIATAVGWNLYDSSVGGTRLAWGTLTASLGMASADTYAFAAGALKITMV